jgi:exopolysaccharide biosynthesis polyprenyl glycosylphosphotransferase
MLKEKDRLLRQILRIFDVLLTVPSFYIAYYLHIEIITPIFSSFFTGLYPIEIYSWILDATIPLCLVLFHVMGLYKPVRMESPKRILWRVFWAMAILAFVEYILIYVLLGRFYVSRFFVSLFITIYLTLLVAFRFSLLSLLYRIRERGVNFYRVLIIGTGKTAKEVYEEIETHRFWGLKLSGFIAGATHHPHVPNQKVIGELKDLERILKKEVIDEVFVALDEKERADREEIFKICEKVGISAYLVPAYYEWQLAKSTTISLGKLNLIQFFTIPINPYLLGIKRGIDIVVSSFVLIFFPLLYVLIGGLIKLESPGPILYRQIRVAHNKRQFNCYKFRTMLESADTRIDLLERVNETTGPIRKSRNDPRVTRVGRLLRRFSIDEIPQFINIFKGEMSLVGPRPPIPDEVERYEFHQLRKLSVKQGLTGLWQVRGRDAVKSFEERLKLDLYYIDHWSLWMDFKIILRTLFIIFRGAS